MKKSQADNNNNTPRRAYVAIAVMIAVLAAVTIVSLVLFEYQVSLVGTGSGEQTSYARHYAFIGDRSNAFLQSAYAAAAKAGTTSGDYVEFTGNNLNAGYTDLQLMDIAVKSGTDGIIVNANDSDEMSDAIGAAEDAGIPVVCIGSDSYGSTRQSYVGISYYNLGQAYGTELVHYVSGLSSRDVIPVQQVLILTSSSERSRGQNLVYTGMRDYIRSVNYSSYFHFTTQAVGNGTMFSAAEDITDLFNSDDLPDIIVCLDETNTTAACQSIVDTNHVGDITILGFYTNDTILNAVSKQILAATFTIDADRIGREAVNCLNEYIRNGFVTDYVPIDIETITSENVESYLNTNSADSDTEQNSNG